MKFDKNILTKHICVKTYYYKDKRFVDSDNDVVSEASLGAVDLSKMISAIVLLVFIPIVICHFVKLAYKRHENFPPGPPSLPVYGAYWFILAAEFHNLSGAFWKLGQKYRTKILGFYLAGIPAIVINDGDLIKEMLNREEFDGRMDIILARLRSYWKKLGIFFTDGYYWHVQRRFSLRYMRDFGFGRRDPTLEAVVDAEIKEMIDMRISGPKYEAEELLVKGELIFLPHFFAVPFINGMLQVFARMTIQRPDYHVLWDMAKGALLFQRSSDDIGSALSLTPWLKDVMPNWSGYNSLRKGNQYLLDFFEKLLMEVMESHEAGHDRHFLDMYVSKMKEEIKQEGRSTFSSDQLILTCIDYMFPSATAVEMVLTMLVERLLLQPELQERIHEELDRVVGRDRVPTLDDRRNLPFTEACIREMMRYETLVPLGLPHRAMSDTSIGGYDIPENTMVAANYVPMHMDQTIWGDPENFRPERFIVDGQLRPAKDKSLPFGAGRRLCAGETYARHTMFQVFAGFMQAFDVSTADGISLSKPSRRIQGIITTIPEFWVRVTPRS